MPFKKTVNTKAFQMNIFTAIQSSIRDVRLLFPNSLSCWKPGGWSLFYGSQIADCDNGDGILCLPPIAPILQITPILSKNKREEIWKLVEISFLQESALT